MSNLEEYLCSSTKVIHVLSDIFVNPNANKNENYWFLCTRTKIKMQIFCKMTIITLLLLYLPKTMITKYMIEY